MAVNRYLIPRYEEEYDPGMRIYAVQTARPLRALFSTFFFAGAVRA